MAGDGRPLGVALAGTVCISSSAIVMRLADTSASITALGRCLFALPVLGILLLLERRRGEATLAARSAGRRSAGRRWAGRRWAGRRWAGRRWAGRRSAERRWAGRRWAGQRWRWLARISGLFLSADLILWSHSIAAIGAGLGTVIPSFQVVVISLLAWVLLGERPRRSLLIAFPVMLTGLALVGGLTGARAYGAHPALGVAEGLGVSLLYAAYIFILRQATSADDKPSPVATLYEATLGATIGSVVIGLALRDFRLGHAWPTLGWLALLAVTSQVIGWLLITVSMPKLPAWMIGAVLLIQPGGSVLLGYLILSERPSASQLLGVGLMLAGVLVAVSGRAAKHEDHPPGARSVEGDIVVEVAVAGGEREPAD